MPYIISRNRAEDYAKWKRAFDEGSAERRRAGGIKNQQVFRSADDPTEVIVLTEVEDVDRGRQYFQSTVLREALQRSGVREHRVYYAEP